MRLQGKEPFGVASGYSKKNVAKLEAKPNRRSTFQSRSLVYRLRPLARESELKKDARELRLKTDTSRDGPKKAVALSNLILSFFSRLYNLPRTCYSKKRTRKKTMAALPRKATPTLGLKLCMRAILQVKSLMDVMTSQRTKESEESGR